jgi:hypothetical protein
MLSTNDGTLFIEKMPPMLHNTSAKLTVVGDMVAAILVATIAILAATFNNELMP